MVDFGQVSVDLRQVIGRRDDEFQLVIVSLDQLTDDGRAMALFIVFLSPRPCPFFVGRGIGKLGTDRHQIARQIAINCPSGFHRDVHPGGIDTLTKGDNIVRQHRFAAGDDHVAAVAVMLIDRGINRVENVAGVHHLAFGLPRCKRRVAESAPQITAAGSDENAGGSREAAFALVGVVNFGNEHPGWSVRFDRLSL